MRFRLIESFSLDETLSFEGKEELKHIVGALKSSLRVIPSWRLRKESKDNGSFKGLVNQATDDEIIRACNELGIHVTVNRNGKFTIR